MVMAGLIEREPDGRLYNSYVAVGPEGFLTKYHKLHPFISPHLTPGRGYHVFEIRGVKVGFLICYDNNLPENVRATALLGAEVIVMPHVTGCTPVVDARPRARWTRRSGTIASATRPACGRSSRAPRGAAGSCAGCRRGRGRTASSRVFANNIGRDDDTIKPGLAMILDPNGEVIVESHALDDDVVVGLLTADALDPGPRPALPAARRPELYGQARRAPSAGPSTRDQPGLEAGI